MDVSKCLRFLLPVMFLSIGRGDVVPIRYPIDNPCILVDIDAAFQLVWTDADAKDQAIPDFTLEDTSVDAGNCATITPVPNVVMDWSDGVTFTFFFTNQSGNAEIGWTLRYSPDAVFKNSNTELVTHSGNLGTGSPNMAYSCHHVPVVNDTQTKTGMNKYTLTITIKSVKAQAFGVTNGKYSEEDKCPADIGSTFTTPTTSKLTSRTGSTKPSTKPSTVSSSALTSPTTKPTHGTTVIPKPSTALTKHSTPTSKPTVPTTSAPAPNRRVKEWFEVHTDGKMCILMVGEFILSLAYTKTDNEYGFVDIAIQNIDSVTGACSEEVNVVSVTFYEDWQMNLTISKKTTSTLLMADGDVSYYWSNINLKYKYTTELGGKPLFPDVKANVTAPALNVTLASGTYEASTGGSYLCNSNQEIDLGGGNKLQTWSLQYKAFSDGSFAFSPQNTQECSKDSRKNIMIPIASGATIVAMALFVLVVYLIERFKHKCVQTSEGRRST